MYSEHFILIPVALYFLYTSRTGIMYSSLLLVTFSMNCLQAKSPEIISENPCNLSKFMRIQPTRVLIFKSSEWFAMRFIVVDYLNANNPC